VATLAARPHRPAAEQKKYTGKRIDLDFRGAKIENMMKLLSDVGEVQIIVDPSVKATVTIRLRNVPWDEALDIVLRDKGLRAERQGDVIHVRLPK
jgi:type IV pilus assembly protein PilQ